MIAQQFHGKNWPKEEIEPLSRRRRAAITTTCYKRASGGALTACKLTDAQRERLAGYAELDERAVRKTVGVAPDIIGAAIAGESLAPAIIGRWRLSVARVPQHAPISEKAAQIVAPAALASGAAGLGP